MSVLCLVLGDQVSRNLSALDGLNATAPATFADVTLEPDEMAF